jgi:RimJ/RimL family protein N-acetyltransferase
LGLHKIISGHVSENIASIKGNQRLGFKIEGTFRKHVLVEGEFKDVTQMGLLREEFQPYKQRDRR